MRRPGAPDCLAIINGPEDGAEFPLVRMPAVIGRDPLCGILVSLDGAVAPRHAQLSVVADGYRVRRLGGRGKVYVDGREAGVIRSRIARDGSGIQVGQTLFVLACAPDGLACRSRGLVSESDIVWAAHKGLRTLATLCRQAIGYAAWGTGRLFTNWWLLLGIAVGLYFFWPPFNRLVYLTYYNTIRRVLDLM